MLADGIATEVRSVTRLWRDEAATRRRISAHDPVADTLEYCAGEISARLRDAELHAETVTVEQYARSQGVTPQTVRGWIRRQRLAASLGPKGWVIMKDARVSRSARLKSA